MTRKTGFTLIELLVVIAIIGILAAIIFPVFMRAKDSAYRSGDLSNMNAIRNAIQLYRADQEAYPPQILGYGTPYMPGPQLAQVVPAAQLHAALYPKRLQSIDSLKPAFDREEGNTTTVAVWPNVDPRPIGSAPVADLDGNGVVDAADDIPGARQAYGPTVYFCIPSATLPGCVQYASNAAADGAPFYKISGYDVADVKVAPFGSPDRWEIHYTLQWSSLAIGGGSRSDDPRQLIYNEPPDNTVVTWDSWFRDYDSSNLLSHTKKDFVLFLNGGARAYDSQNMSDRSWRVTP